MINTLEFSIPLINSIVMLMCENKYVYCSIVKVVLNSNFYKVTSDYIFLIYLLIYCMFMKIILTT